MNVVAPSPKPKQVRVTEFPRRPEHPAFDVHRPTDSRGPWPLVVLIHGGAWMLGGKSQVGDIARAIALRGHVVVCPSYRLSSIGTWGTNTVTAMLLGVVLLAVVWTDGDPATHGHAWLWGLVGLTFLMFWVVLAGCTQQPVVEHPRHIEDVARVFRIAWDRAEEWGADRSRTHVVGHSAGAHLASLLSTNGAYLRAEGLHRACIRSVVALSGVYAEAVMRDHVVSRQLLRQVFWHHPYSAFANAHVDAATPPHLLVNANEHRLFAAHAREYIETLRRHGVYVQHLFVPEATHLTIHRHWTGVHAHVLERVLHFWDQVTQR